VRANQRAPARCQGSSASPRSAARHLLAQRHSDLRIHDHEPRRRLIGSLAAIGQQVPVVVIRDGEQLVLIDGYLGVDGLRRLGRDTAAAAMWPLSEADVLLHHRHLTIGKHAAIEDAWLWADYASTD
jgi:hypothetical protein